MDISAAEIKKLAAACGFELAGIAAPEPAVDYSKFERWRARGRAGEMTYLTDRRGDLRSDPRKLLPSVQSILCVGKLYNSSAPHSTDARDDEGLARISRYAWGGDYHELLRRDLEELVHRLRELHGEPFEARICVDTAPLLERSYARLAGLGWIGKNTCLINQSSGSWFFLGEVLLSIHLAPDAPVAERCGTCTRCIDACPTAAIVPDSEGGWSLDSRLCISYLTIEKRGAIAPELAAQTGNHVFGCDICQDVCPWNRRAPVTAEPSFAPNPMVLDLDALSVLTEEEFRTSFRHSPVWRAKYAGFLRNVAAAIGNSGQLRLLPAAERLATHADPVVSEAARQAIGRLELLGREYSNS